MRGRGFSAVLSASPASRPLYRLYYQERLLVETSRGCRGARRAASAATSQKGLFCVGVGNACVCKRGAPSLLAVHASAVQLCRKAGSLLAVSAWAALGAPRRRACARCIHVKIMCVIVVLLMLYC
jgi:hypothetical protein